MKEKYLSDIIYAAISSVKEYKFKTTDSRKDKAKKEGKTFNELQFKNKLRSSIFVEAVAVNLFKEYGDDYLLNVIKIDKKKEIRKKGEFMLDIVISKSESIGNYKYDSKFIWAVESESQYVLSEFIKDFSKLINVKSENYLYLNGLVSKDSKTKENDIQNRLKEALSILNKSNISKNENFYISFFPYPGRPNDPAIETIFNELSLSGVNPNKETYTFDDIICGKYAHLDTIETFKYVGNEFELISMCPRDED